MKNTVLLYNGISTAFADGDNVPSISLMALSAYLKTKGYAIRLVLDRHTDEELHARLADCLAVGFSVFTGNGLGRSLRMAERIRRIAPDIPLVWGGYHPTLETEQVLRSGLADYVVRGEGERTLEELLNHLRDPAGRDLRGIEGLSFRVGEEIVNNAPRIASPMSEYPLPDYGLYEHVYAKNGTLHYMGSRGCPFDCKFCCASAFNRMQGRKCDQLSLERVIEDLRTLVSRYSPVFIEFFDDTFFTNKDRVAGFIKMYKENGFTFKWTALGRCDFFANSDDSMLQGLRQINLQKVLFGVESGSQRILDMLRKRIRVEDVTAAAAKVHANGIPGDYTLINGFPNETMGDVKASLRLRRRIKTIAPESTVRFYVYTPLPGTETMDECISLGYKKPATVRDWVEHEYHVFRSPWLTPGYARLVSNIAWMALFDTSNFSGGSTLMGIGHALAKWDSKIRLQLNILSFAPEFMLLSAIYRRRLRTAVSTRDQ